ncbi:hypothetical protein [Streptomyces wuyuanensis]
MALAAWAWTTKRPRRLPELGEPAPDGITGRALLLVEECANR